MLLVKEPIPYPSVVLVPSIVGSFLVLQQTPLTIISDFPSLVITPPDFAVVASIEVTGTVVRVGSFSGSQPLNINEIHPTIIQRLIRYIFSTVNYFELKTNNQKLFLIRNSNYET